MRNKRTNSGQDISLISHPIPEERGDDARPRLSLGYPKPDNGVAFGLFSLSSLFSHQCATALTFGRRGANEANEAKKLGAAQHRTKTRTVDQNQYWHLNPNKEPTP
jgi:hypothetical protein